MIHEVVDPNTGAILFKKDKDSKDIEYLLKKMEEMEKEIKQLKKKAK